MIILVESMQILAKIDQRHFPKRHRALRSRDQTFHVKDGEGGECHTLEMEKKPCLQRQDWDLNPAFSIPGSALTLLLHN